MYRKVKISLLALLGASDVYGQADAATAKQVHGREELDRNGDSKLGDILKRLPGVTTGGKFTTPIGKEHSLAAGWDVELGPTACGSSTPAIKSAFLQII